MVNQGKPEIFAGVKETLQSHCQLCIRRGQYKVLKLSRSPLGDGCSCPNLYSPVLCSTGLEAVLP